MARADVVGLGKQTAQGTMNATPTIYVPVTSADANLNQSSIDIDETVGDRFALDPDPGSRFYEVPMSGAVRPTALPRILSGFLGPPTTTTPGGGTTSRNHLFDPIANTALVWHSILVGRADPTPTKITDLFYDALGNSITLSCTAGEYMLFDASFIAAKLNEAQTFPVAPTIDTSAKFAFHKLTAYIHPSGGSEAAFSCASFSATLNNNVDTDYFVLGAIDPYKVDYGNADVELTFEVREALDTHYRRALQTTPTPCKLRFIAEGSVIEGSIKYVVEVTVARAIYTAAPAPISGSDKLKGIVVTATGVKDATTSKVMDVRVVNTTTAY